MRGWEGEGYRKKTVKATGGKELVTFKASKKTGEPGLSPATTYSLLPPPNHKHVGRLLSNEHVKKVTRDALCRTDGWLHSDRREGGGCGPGER